MVKMAIMARHGNNSSPTGNQDYRGNSYCKVRDTVFVLHYNIIVKELQGLSQMAALQSVSAPGKTRYNFLAWRLKHPH